MEKEHPGDRLHVCASKLAFLQDVFSQDTVKEFRFSEDGHAGFYLILRDIEVEIKSIATEVK